MWGDLGWFQEFIDAFIGAFRSLFTGLNASDGTTNAFTAAWESFSSWVSGIGTGSIRDFLNG
ncbi:MAG: hypothetical protein LBT21_05625 [Oscillospiraceae bacterium]|jgi:hypothetical protein|nr:hypothetical protein [Oscillospiraceae bacterium]